MALPQAAPAAANAAGLGVHRGTSQLIFDWMYAEATLLDAVRMDTTHLLLGIVNEGDSLAARLLIHYGADLESLRRAANPGREVVPASAPEGSAQELAASE